MKKAIYAGSFDPVTLGHLDIIKRAAAIADELIVTVMINSSKKPLFTDEEKISMLKEAVKGIPGVTVKTWDGLLVDFAKKENAGFVVRGLRCASDFEYELQIANVNKTLAPELETVFLAASSELAFVSSSIVREVASYGGDISKLVPPFVAERVKEKF